MKNIYKIISLFIFVCLLVVFAAGCASFDTETSESTLGDIQGGGKTDEVTSFYEDPLHRPVDYPKLYYPAGNKMFAKLEITKVYEEAYFLASDGEFKNPYLLAEVTVLEDFYKYTEENTSFTVMLALESAEDGAFQKTKEVFTRADNLYAYCSLKGGEGYLNVEMVAKNADDIKLGVFSDDIRIDLLYLIPCVGGCADITLLKDKENECAEKLKDFVYDGQLATELKNNIKELAKK